MESSQNTNSSKLLWLVLLPARMNKINLKMMALEWSQHSSYYKSMGVLQSLVGSCRISNPSKIYMCVLISCKNNEEPIKNKGARVVTRFPPLKPIESVGPRTDRRMDAGSRPIL